MNIKKLGFTLSVPAIILSSASLLSGCSQDNSNNAQTTQSSGPVVVYSARAEHLIKPLFDEFTQQTGIEVQFQTGKANALVERLKAEGSNTPADMLMTVDVGNLWYAATQDLFQPIKSDLIEKHIPAHLREPSGLWTGLSVRARTLVYHVDKLNPNDIQSYEDLADPKWKGRLCLRTSESVYNKSLVSSMIAHYGEPKTETLIQGWLSNLATKPQAKDSLVMDAIAAGQCDFGLVNTYYYGGLQVKKPDTPLRLGWLNQKQQGTHINISGAGVLKHAKNPKGAQVLLEWLASEKAQALYAELNKEFPAKPGMPLDPMVQAWGEFKQDQLNLSRVGELQTSAAILINKVGYE